MIVVNMPGAGVNEAVTKMTAWGLLQKQSVVFQWLAVMHAGSQTAASLSTNIMS